MEDNLRKSCQGVPLPARGQLGMGRGGGGGTLSETLKTCQVTNL